MKSSGIALLASLAAAVGLAQAEDRSGAHGFDFLHGEWRVHHRLKRPLDNPQWTEFDGTSSIRPLMDGSSNVENNIFHRPAGVTYGVALRAYDAKSGLWSIWWLDSRYPSGAMDPPMQGRFENGVGTFYGDGVLDGKPMRTRFIWSQPTPGTARWEQAYSFDAGKTWQVNWIMEFKRELPKT